MRNILFVAIVGLAAFIAAHQAPQTPQTPQPPQVTQQSPEDAALEAYENQFADWPRSYCLACEGGQHEM
jgi:hypothetical protein